MLALLAIAAAVAQPAPAPLVKRGEGVVLVVEDGVIRITTPGRALSSGAAGDTVRVVSLATHRTLHGTVDGAGRVRVTP